MFILLLIFVLICFWLYRRHIKMSILSRNGIPGDNNHLIYGNLFNMNGNSLVERQKNLIKKYGKIVGYYNGGNAIVLVADPELAHRIQIKDFHNFTNRSDFVKYFHPSTKSSGALTMSRDNQWKKIRRILLQIFSTPNFKKMTPLIDESIESFIKIIDNKSKIGAEFNIYDSYKKLSLETILEMLFSKKINAQNEQNECELLKTIYQYLEFKINKKILMIYLCFPELANFIQILRGYTEQFCVWLGYYPISFLLNTCNELIEIRRANPESHNIDFLQFMLDSKESIEKKNDKEYKTILGNENISRNKVDNNNQIDINKNYNILTDDEIKYNSIIFIMAGHDTTSSGLSFITHLLVSNPDIQEMIRKEVINLKEMEGNLDYNNLNKLQYMECVINETMRLYPPVVNGVTRECLQDYKYKNIIIPKGTTVVICTHFLQNDPDFWSEAEKFDPMRFSTQRKHEINCGSWQPFGDGNRKCIGMRLSLLVIKLCLAKLLLEYRLDYGPNTELETLELKYRTLSVAPKNGIFVRAVKIKTDS